MYWQLGVSLLVLVSVSTSFAHSAVTASLKPRLSPQAVVVLEDETPVKPTLLRTVSFGDARPSGDAEDQRSREQFPTEEQIKLLLTQAERAFDQYESSIKLENQLSGGDLPSDLQSMISKDREVLKMGRAVIGDIQKNPKSFNSPLGFLLIGQLDDASRNMAICDGQAGMEAADAIQKANTTEGFSKLHIAQACLSSSVLLQTVSETAFNMYSQYLLANYQLYQRTFETMQKTSEALRTCDGMLKNQRRGKKAGSPPNE